MGRKETGIAFEWGISMEKAVEANSLEQLLTLQLINILQISIVLKQFHPLANSRLPPLLARSWQRIAAT